MTQHKPIFSRRAFLRVFGRLSALAIVQYTSTAVSASAPATTQATTYGAGAYGAGLYGAGAYGLSSLSAKLANQQLKKEA